MFSSLDILRITSKLEKKAEELQCFVKLCCSKTPINVGVGSGVFKRFIQNKWEFKSILAGNNINVTETNNEIVINAIAEPISCNDIKSCIGISSSGGSNRYLNEQGQFNTISSSGFSCSDLNFCSTSNLPEGSNLYYTSGRVLSEITGKNISLFTNNVNYITSSALTPYLTTVNADLVYYKIPTGSTSEYIRGDGSLNIFPAIDRKSVV